MNKRKIDTFSSGFFIRFMLTHVLTYLFFGLLFLSISNYFDVFQKDALLNQVMRPSNSLIVRMAVLIQFVRGLVLASAVYFVRSAIIGTKYGWFKLFWLMWVLTSIGAVVTGPGSIEGFIYTKFHHNPLIGMPEITLQMLAFSWLFCRWENRHI